jgi:hypothetical protein
MEMPIYRELWFFTVTKLSKSRENVEDDHRSGIPISSTNDQNVEVVRTVMAKDRQITVRMIAEATGLDKSAVNRILTVQLVRTDIADDWMLQHDNAPAHTALSIGEFLAKKDILIFPQPPYSTDLAPYNFYLFPELK